MSHRRAVLTALTLTTAAAIAASPAIAAPSPPAVTEIDVICDAIGADTVTITGDLASGGTATIEDGPLKIVGEPGFTGKDSAGRSVAVRPTGQGSVCTAQTPTSGDELADVIPSARAATATSTGEVDGRLTFTVEIQDTPTPLSQQRSAQAQTSAAASFPFESELRSYLNSRPGAVGVAVRLPGTGRSFTYTKVSSRNVTASIVKVHIMAAVMMKAQDEGRSLSSWEKSQMSPMIRYSDNNAATALFNHIGGRSGLDRAAARLGMDATHADPYNHWGLTSTTAADQAELMEHFARPSDALNQSNRYYGLSLMRSISSSQDWGVTSGPPSGSVALKNGWLPRTDGWHVNSIGWANVSTADYTIGVLTHHNPGNMSTEIATIEGVSRIIYRNRAQLRPQEPPKERAKRGDVDGDGNADLIGVSATGRVYLMPGNGRGDFGSKRVIRTGLADARWIGHAGDVNRDGRSDVLVRRRDGRLQLMLASSGGNLGSAKTLVSGWGGSVTSITSGGDVNGNDQLDVLIRLPNGEVRRYELSDSGNLTRIGSMGRPAVWYQEIMLVHDVSGDGLDDLRGIAGGGRMRTWTSSRGTSWHQASATSLGWNQYRTVTVPGDINSTGEGQDDIVGVLPSGEGRSFFGYAGGGHTTYHRTISEYLGNLELIG
ncbi:FG-GAP-like repeat-containing protein [Janibacter anophelis]|uniref:FG-GAP-like repeat-containing protein n=1 Tax=Janibacter anophelis TaxID=319054 RepID=UPI0013B05957|nr:FG-GAP-like repeat-containing protein [Janibacter anophelis]